MKGPTFILQQLILIIPTRTNSAPIWGQTDSICVKNEVNLIFAHKMACEHSRRIIFFMDKTMNCSLTIAVRILSQNIKFVLQMRINRCLLVSTKVQKSHNYPHIGHILLIKCKMIIVQRLGTLNLSLGQRKDSQWPSLWAAVCNIRALLHLISGYGRESEGNLNFELTECWPKNHCKKDKQHRECLSGMVCEKI